MNVFTLLKISYVSISLSVLSCHEYGVNIVFGVQYLHVTCFDFSKVYMHIHVHALV